MKTLVAYFSAEFGATRAVAEELAASLGADLFEIVPETPYSDADLRWTNPLARCNREHLSGKDVPVAGKVEDFAQYDTVQSPLFRDPMLDDLDTAFGKGVHPGSAREAQNT